MSGTAVRQLHLYFSGRVIDLLGIEMYQSPVAAIAELIANGWDADAENVEVVLPDALGADAEIIIQDDGNGMTFAECQDRYLAVGRNRRLEEGDRSPNGRPFLGRKGIGKFAGFGIADILEIDTTSIVSGEHTLFRLNLEQLRSHAFVVNQPREVEVIIADGPADERKASHGTKVRLRSLKLTQRRDPGVFARQMARRFLLAQQTYNFHVAVNGIDLPESVDPFAVQFEFPRDYRPGEEPPGLEIVGDWGRETLEDGNTIDWKIRFAEDPIPDEEFRGVAVYCGVKVAQTPPFFFQLSGGLGGQHGEQYLSGRVRADYLDRLPGDNITTERQRINWESSDAVPLLAWGRRRVASLLNLWKERRGEDRAKTLEERLTVFGARLNKLPSSERRTVKRALQRIASIETLNTTEFADLANALLTAWEGGRLRGIIDDISRVENMEASVLLSILAEEQVLSALHIAEVVRAKVGIINGLQKRIERRELENNIRDYIAKIHG